MHDGTQDDVSDGPPHLKGGDGTGPPGAEYLTANVPSGVGTLTAFGPTPSDRRAARAAALERDGVLRRGQGELPSASAALRSDAEEQIWAGVRAAIREEYRVTADGELSGRLLAQFLQIGSGFRFEVDPEDARFLPFHVEPLLDQAADLLDRGMRDRAEWDDLAAKQFNLSVELNEYADLDEVHRDEAAAGFYQHDHQAAQADLTAERTAVTMNGLSAGAVSSLLNELLSNPKLVEQYNAARRQAWLTGLLPYSFSGQQFGKYVQHRWDGDPDSVSRHAVAAAEVISVYTLSLQRAGMSLQGETFDNTAAIARARVPGLDAKAEWERRNAEFRARRTAVARRYQDLKVRAAREPDGALNYAKRMAGLDERYRADFRNAVARVRAVAPGLADVYGYSEPIPADDGRPGYFDDWLLWTRKAINWLVRFSRLDQSYVLPISVRRHAGPAWRDGWRTGRWEFELSEATFPEQCHVRLRGLTAFVEGSEPNETWPVRVRVPVQGMYRHQSDAVVEVDQGCIPPCRIGRVGVRDRPREGDVVGTSALHNVSPLGRWVVELGPRSTRGRHCTELTDVQLDLLITMQASPGVTRTTHQRSSGRGVGARV